MPQELGESLQGVVVCHAAVSAAMLANFGRAIARRLLAEGSVLHFFASQARVFGAAPPIADLEALGVRFHGLRLPRSIAPLRDLAAITSMARAFRRVGAHVVHTRGSVMGCLGRVAARIARVPVILHHQDDLYFREYRRGSIMRRMAATVERGLFSLSQGSFFVSRAVLNDALSARFRPDRCFLVGHDLGEAFQLACSEPEARRIRGLERLHAIGVPRHAKVAGCVARLAPLKGVDFLIDVAASIAKDAPGWSFVLKGDGPLRDACLRNVLRLGLRGVFFLVTEDLPGDAVPDVFAAFDLFVLPTRREGFGMVFAEAMAMGVPVVGPRMEPVTEVVPDGCGLLLPPDDHEAWARGLLGIMRDPETRTRLAAAGRAHALREWCGYRAAERVIGVYRRFLEEKSLLRHRQRSHAPPRDV